jgi:putative redox protein
MKVELAWDGDLKFSADTGKTTILFDSDGNAGPSPVQALVASLGACMGMDLVYFLRRSRVAAERVALRLVVQRAPDDPHRVLAVELTADIHGPASDEVVARGIALSREKYCSVWASLRQDIVFTTRFTVHRPTA